MWSRAANLNLRSRVPVISGHLAPAPSRRHLLWSAVVAMSQPGEYTYKCGRNLLVWKFYACLHAIQALTELSMVSDRYPRPGMTVDACIVSKQQPSKVLLIKRQKAPCKVQPHRKHSPIYALVSFMPSSRVCPLTPHNLSAGPMGSARRICG